MSRTAGKNRGTSPIKILIVDNNQEICDICRKFLERDGYHVDTLVDPTRAVKKFIQEKYQIVLLDLEFPINKELVTGKKILYALLDLKTDVCIIILSGKASHEDIIEMLGNRRAFDMVLKPVTGEKLREVVRNAIAKQGFAVNRAQEIALEVGRRVRAERRERKLTMKELSSRVSLSTSLISQIERGESSPSIPTLCKISTALNVPLTKLFKDF